jgi:acetyltransferase-like isoleucine patch superfamily enzyme
MIRDRVKAAALAVATAAIAPLLASYRLRALIVGEDRALEGSSALLSLVPGLTGQYLRRAFYGHALASCHPTATIEFGVLLSQAGARIDEHAYVGPRCHLGLVHIERDALIAAGVHIPSGPETHGTADLSTPIRMQPGRRRMIRIGAGSWIGSAAVVMADVGRDSVVGAGSVVTRPVPDRVMAAGAPARVVRERARTRESA